MSSERSPLLHQEVTQQRSAPRPDLRNSPENVIVDGSDTHSSEGKKTSSCYQIFDLIHPRF